MIFWTVAEFGDSRRFRRTVAEFGDKLSPFPATIVTEFGDCSRQCVYRA